MALILSLLMVASGYTGLIRVGDRVLDCSQILNRYAHGGVPSVKEDEKVKLCCISLRTIPPQGAVGELLLLHLRICRQLGR